MKDLTSIPLLEIPLHSAAGDGFLKALRIYGTVHGAQKEAVLFTVLHIGREQSWILQGANQQPGLVICLELGSQRLAREHFRRDPPSPAELEAAIMVVEDEVMPVAKKLLAGSSLFTSDTGIADIASVATGSDEATTTLDLQTVERVFNRLANLSLGRPRSQGNLPAEGPFAANLLILREFMHHLRFERITIQSSTD
jgi:exopolyphosphatase/pppGpp-phosphohydrolase